MDEPDDSLNCAKQSNEPDQAALEAPSDEEKKTARTESQSALSQTECTADSEGKAPSDGPVNPLVEPLSPGPNNFNAEEKPKGTAVSRLITMLGGKEMRRNHDLRSRSGHCISAFRLSSAILQP